MKKASTLLLAIFMVGIALLIFAPASSAAELKATDVKIPAAAVQAAIERAHGPLVVMCPGARTALAAYNACKQRCAQAAAAAPITPAELASCGNMTAAQCAEMLIAQRAEHCIKTAGAGCADEFAKLQRENWECKKCAELKAQEAAAERDVIAKKNAAAAALTALHRANAALHAAQARQQALENARKRMCQAAQK